LSNPAGIQSGLHIGVIIQGLNDRDNVWVLQENQSAIAVVVRKSSKSFWTHCDLGMDFEN
jgi:hypothetical protein